MVERDPYFELRKMQGSNWVSPFRRVCHVLIVAGGLVFATAILYWTLEYGGFQ